MPTISLTLPNNGDDAVVDQYNAALQIIQSLLNGGLDDDNFADEAVILSKLSESVQNALVPVGVTLPYGGSSAPNAAWLLCYGQAISRSTYATLFGILGTSFGVGDGSTTFNVPDLRGRVPVGLDNIGGTAANRIQVSTTITTTNASPTATVASATGLSVGQYVESANVPDGTTITVIAGTTLTLSANATASAGGTAARFSFIGDAQEMGDAGGVQAHAIITAQLASHTHTYTATYNQSNGATGGGENMMRLNSASNQSWTMNSTGSDQPHTNVQPSIVMNYIIKA